MVGVPPHAEKVFMPPPPALVIEKGDGDDGDEGDGDYGDDIVTALAGDSTSQLPAISSSTRDPTLPPTSLLPFKRTKAVEHRLTVWPSFTIFAPSSPAVIPSPIPKCKWSTIFYELPLPILREVKRCLLRV